jgi:hypothetical protein
MWQHMYLNPSVARLHASCRHGDSSWITASPPVRHARQAASKRGAPKADSLEDVVERACLARGYFD